MALYKNPKTGEVVDISPEKGEALGFELLKVGSPEIRPRSFGMQDIPGELTTDPHDLEANLLSEVPALARVGESIGGGLENVHRESTLAKILGALTLTSPEEVESGSAAVGSIVKDLSKMISPADLATLGIFGAGKTLGKAGLARVAEILNQGTSATVAGLGTVNAVEGVREGDLQKVGKGALLAGLGGLGLRSGVHGDLAKVEALPERELASVKRLGPEIESSRLPQKLDIPEKPIPAEAPIEVPEKTITPTEINLDKQKAPEGATFTDNRGTYQEETTSAIQALFDKSVEVGNVPRASAYGTQIVKGHLPDTEIAHIPGDGGFTTTNGIITDLANTSVGTPNGARLFLTAIEQGYTPPDIKKMSPDTVNAVEGILKRTGLSWDDIYNPERRAVAFENLAASKLGRRLEVKPNEQAGIPSELSGKVKEPIAGGAGELSSGSRSTRDVDSSNAALQPVRAIEGPKSPTEQSDSELASSITEIEGILKKHPNDPLIAKTLQPALEELKVEKANRNISISAGGKKVITFKDWYESVKKEKFEGYKDVDPEVKKTLQTEYEGWKKNPEANPANTVTPPEETPLAENIPPSEKPPVPPENVSLPKEPSTPKEDPVKKLVRIINQTAKPARKEQELLQHARNAEVAEKLKSGSVRNAEGEEWYKKSLEAMKGKTEKADFAPVRDKFSDDDVASLFNTIKNDQKLDIYDQVHAGKGLTKLLQGEIPQPHELKILDAAFGPELVKELLAKRSTLQKAEEIFVNVASIPRAMASSIDLSAPLRQGLVLGISHPKAAYAAGKDMFLALKGKGTFEALQDAINTNPNRALGKEAGLYLADKHAYQHGAISGGEEAFMSNFAEKYMPGVERSEMAYIAYLNKLRSDVFDGYVKSIVDGGTKLDSPEGMKALKDAAWFINNATGRGGLGKLERVSGLLNSVFFSPRFQTSRLALMNPKSYINLSPIVRKKAVGDMVKAYGTVAATLGLLSLNKDVDVEIDPRSSDFGKAHIGNARMDLLGGMQPWMRVIAQEVSGRRKTASGKVQELGSTPLAPTRLETVYKFGESKASPAISVLLDSLRGKTVVGDELSAETFASKFAPMFLQDLNDVLDITPVNREGTDFSYDPEFGSVKAPEGLPMVPPAFLGAGMQVYEPKKKGLRSIKPLR